MLHTDIRKIKVGQWGLLTPSQQKAHAHIKERLEQLNEGYEIRVTHDFPILREYKSMLMIGAFGWTDPVNKIKWIRPQHAVIVGGSDIPVTPASVTRQYIHYKFDGKRQRMRKKQAQYMVDSRKSAPLYCTPCTLDDAVYIDIKSAYWSIMRAVGITPEYYPNRYLAKGVFVDDFPYPQEKLMRNIIVSSGLPTSATQWDGEEMKVIRTGGSYVNLMLWGVCMDILHTFARDMVAVGAVYVHTDGFIFQRRDLDSARAVANAWGMPVGVKYEGKCDVMGVATYNFQGVKDTRWRRTHCHYTDRLQPVDGDWVRQYFKFWSDRAKLLDDENIFN